MDIGDMAYVVRYTQPFRYTVAGTDDQIVIMKSEGPDRQGEERQIVLVVRERQRQMGSTRAGPDRL